MLFNLSLAAVFGVLEFIAGGMIGTATAAVIYRARLSTALLLRAALLAGLTFLAVTAIGGWAKEHESFFNGRPVDVGQEGERRWLQNRIAENELALCVTLSIAAGLLAGIRVASKGSKEEG